MDATSRRPQLPALSYLDIEKGNADDEAYLPRPNDGPHHTRTSETSPTSTRNEPFRSAPPPPYNHSQSTSWSGGKSEERDKCDSRRTSGEGFDVAKQMPRQSLPSISEALGVDSQAPYASTASTIQASSQANAQSSPPPSFKRPYGMEAPRSHESYGSPAASQHPTFPQDDRAPRSYSSQEPRSSSHLQPSQPPRPGHVESYSTAPHHEHAPQPSSNSTSTSRFGYGYTPYPPRYSDPAPAAHSSGPIYQPSSQYAPPQASTAHWRSDSTSSRIGAEEQASQSATYGESVKRHLDLYDMEAALNDIAQSSGIVLDFSRRYGDRMHRTVRSTPSLSTLPSIVEVDDMMTKSRLQLDALNKIRDVIIDQQIVYDQQVAEQRHQSKIYREAPPPQAAENHSDVDDGKGGFAGAEPKKRRGRAAPPGRCHSCNRAETPEWRRGPDGARTLCNACGLHYAKLTRKQTNANKANAASSSSNLRPKES